MTAASFPQQYRQIRSSLLALLLAVTFASGLAIGTIVPRFIIEKTAPVAAAGVSTASTAGTWAASVAALHTERELRGAGSTASGPAGSASLQDVPRLPWNMDPEYRAATAAGRSAPSGNSVGDGAVARTSRTPR